jgi:hypothetical protein
LWAFAAEGITVELGNEVGVCFDHTQYQYDSNGDLVPDAETPSCTTLSNDDADFDGLADHLTWGCGPLPPP